MKNFILSLCFVLVSCSEDELRSTSYLSENIDQSNQSKSGNCGTNVISDYNSAILECKYTYSRSDIDDCLAKLNKFKSKYPEINCSAEKGFGLDRETFRVTGFHIDQLITEFSNL